jgi:hypothetical protein
MRVEVLRYGWDDGNPLSGTAARDQARANPG